MERAAQQHIIVSAPTVERTVQRRRHKFADRHAKPRFKVYSDERRVEIKVRSLRLPVHRHVVKASASLASAPWTGSLHERLASARQTTRSGSLRVKWKAPDIAQNPSEGIGLLRAVSTWEFRLPKRNICLQVCYAGQSATVKITLLHNGILAVRF
jgi:hypothetical protein